MYDPSTGAYAEASEVLRKHNLQPIELQAKEGLALINGTQLITSIAAEAVVRAKRVARQADVVAAMYVREAEEWMCKYVFFFVLFCFPFFFL